MFTHTSIKRLKIPTVIAFSCFDNFGTFGRAPSKTRTKAPNLATATRTAVNSEIVISDHHSHATPDSKLKTLVLGTCSNFAAKRVPSTEELFPIKLWLESFSLSLLQSSKIQVLLEFDVEIFTPFYVKMVWIWTSQADLRNNYRVSLAEPVVNSRHLINLNWRVPALI